MPEEIKTIGSSLTAIAQNVEKLRSSKTYFHGKTDDDYVVSDPMYTYFVFNAVCTIALFLKFFYISPNKYKGGSDCAEEKTLFFHSYDEASIINCNNSEAVTYKTMSGEKIIYINYDTRRKITFNNLI